MQIHNSVSRAKKKLHIIHQTTKPKSQKFKLLSSERSFIHQPEGSNSNSQETLADNLQQVIDKAIAGALPDQTNRQSYTIEASLQRLVMRPEGEKFSNSREGASYRIGTAA